MNTYRVTTVHRIVYVHNVVGIETEKDGDGGRTLVFNRQGAPATRFPLANVASYEVTA